MSQPCLTCQLDLGLFTESDVYYHHLRHHKDHLEPAPPPGALRCPLRPQYDKKGGKIRWTTEFFLPKIISYLPKMTSNMTKYISN